MIDQHGYTLWTYKSEDGSKTEQVYNAQGPNSIIPDFIVLKVDNTTHAGLDRSSASRQVKGFTPSAGVRIVGAWNPPAPTPGQHVSVAVGWPGMVQVT